MRDISTRWLAAACGGLLVAFAAAVSAQTDVINQMAAAPVATNAVSLAESLQTELAFQPYANLAEHSPFMPYFKPGDNSGAGDAGPFFTSGLRLTGFFKMGNDIQASIEDGSDSKKKFFVRIGDTIADTGIKVVSFDLRVRAVLLKKATRKAISNTKKPCPKAPARRAYRRC